MALDITGLDGVRVTLSAGITAAATTIPISAVLSPYKTPPDPGADHYYLTLVDFTNRPGAWERVQVTAKTGSDLTVVRNIASSTGAGIIFAAGATIQWTVGVEDIQESGGGGADTFMLCSGGQSGADQYTNDSSTPQYHCVVQFPIGSPPTFDRDLRWYNTTGRTLTISEFSMHIGFWGSQTGTYTITVQKNSVDTSVSIALAPGQSAATLFRDSVNSFTLDDGEYIVYRVTSDAGTQSGYLLITRMNLMAS